MTWTQHTLTTLTRFARWTISPRSMPGRCPQSPPRKPTTSPQSGAPTHSDFAASRDGKDAAYAKDYNEQYSERLKTELYEAGHEKREAVHTQ